MGLPLLLRMMKCFGWCAQSSVCADDTPLPSEVDAKGGASDRLAIRAEERDRCAAVAIKPCWALPSQAEGMAESNAKLSSSGWGVEVKSASSEGIDVGDSSGIEPLTMTKEERAALMSPGSAIDGSLTYRNG